MLFVLENILQIARGNAAKRAYIELYTQDWIRNWGKIL